MGTNQRPAKRTLAIVKSAIIMVERGENTEQAWRRHVKNNPEDAYADVKIFNFISPNITPNLVIA